VVMIENYRSGLVWQLLRRCRPVVDGLRAAGFSGGWLAAGGPDAVRNLRDPAPAHGQEKSSERSS
jgi:hypothetical protein